MSISRKTGLCFAGMVVVAGLLGVLGGLHIARAQLSSRTNLENWNQHVSQEFDRLVKPTPEQGERLAAHLNQAVTELESIRAETVARSTNVIWRLIAQVEQELTPEQRKAFEAMKPRASDLTLDVLKVHPASPPEKTK